MESVFRHAPYLISKSFTFIQPHARFAASLHSFPAGPQSLSLGSVPEVAPLAPLPSLLSLGSLSRRRIIVVFA